MWWFDKNRSLSCHSGESRNPVSRVHAHFINGGLWPRWIPAFAGMTVILFMLTACGFTPLYSENAAAPYSRIEIANIPDRDGQYLRNLLIDRLYAESAPESPQYLLVVKKLKETISSLGIRKDAISTRGQITVTAKLALIDKTTGKAVLERDISAAGGYNRLANEFATLVSEENTTNLALKELSSVIMTELALHFRRAGGSP